MNVIINFNGGQGSGKSLLSNKIYEYLKNEGFDITQIEDTLTILEPVAKFKKENS
jgi:thymidylate kinase